MNQNKKKLIYRISSIATLFGLILTIGCQPLKPYQYPLTPTPVKWKNDESANSNEVTNEEEAENSSETDDKKIQFKDACETFEPWWEIFNDESLNQLENQALAGSFTIWEALEKVIQARQQVIISRSELFPNINFVPSFLRTGQLIQNPLGTFETTNCPPAATTTTTTTPPEIFRFIQTQLLLPLEVNYKVDLWSKYDNSYHAAIYTAQATVQAYNEVLLSLTADLASNYFILRSLDTQIEVLKQNIQIRQRAFEINSSRFRAGVINFVDVSRADLEVSTAKSDLDDIIRQRGIQENLIATLMGVPASEFSLPFNPVFKPPPSIPSGFPSEILTQRPDIQEAERNLASAYRNIGVAYANFFPSLELNGAIGLETPVISKLFSWKARFWRVGWDAFQTVFDAGKTEANYYYYVSIFREAMDNYQQTVLNAFKEVENELINLRQYALQEKDIGNAIQAAKKTLELSELRYNRGLSFYLDVVDAERDLLRTQQNSAIILGHRYASTVGLIKALGGKINLNENNSKNQCVE